MGAGQGKNLTRFTRKKRREFLGLLADGEDVVDAADAIGMTRQALYLRRRKDDAFAADWAGAVQHGDQVKLAAMEREADRRGQEGVLDPVYYKGKVVGAVRRYSDNLLMFRMKAIAPNKYRERMDHYVDANVRHSGVLKTGGTKPPEEWERDIDEFAAKGPPPLPDEGK